MRWARRRAERLGRLPQPGPSTNLRRVSRPPLVADPEGWWCRQRSIVRGDDFSRATRSHTLARPTDETWAVLVTARWLLTTALPLIERRGLTLVGVTVAELENADSVQLRLPVEAHGSALDAALDAVREKFGSKAITRAVLLGREDGFSPPLLPD